MNIHTHHDRRVHPTEVPTAALKEGGMWAAM